MRIWDVNPGYLNRQSLLGEHRELHGLVSIMVNGKQGYSQHPETRRWLGYGWALKQRHKLLVAEMSLRGYEDRSPVRTRSRMGQWPETYVDDPHEQFRILRVKYRGREGGRIPLPGNAQELWSQHKYSVLARNPVLYQSLGRDVAAMGKADNYADLSLSLIELLKERPEEGGIRNALEHMWGYVANCTSVPGVDMGKWSLKKFLRETQVRALATGQTYLIRSTALAELDLWVER